jgi:Ino eighty subunit 2
MPRLRTRAAPDPAPRAPTATSTRPRRGTASRNDAPSATIQRSSPEETRQSLSLTVKSSPNRLRQATGVPVVGKGTLSRNNIVSGKRARNSRVVREIDSDEDEDEDDIEDEADEVSAMDVDDEEEDDDVDAEGSEEDDMDAEGDEDDEDPIVIPTSKAIPVASKPKISVTKAQDTVEAKEMAMSDDDEELSDPDSDLEDMEDAEGEDDDAEGEDDDELGGAGEDVDMDSDEDMSRDQTPDISKLTRRQRAVLEQEEDGSLLALSNEAQKKKHLTAEEHAMRRAEMARRRKNLSEKRNEEEKVRSTVCAHYATLLILPSWTLSTACSRNNHPNADARAPPQTSMSQVRRARPSQNARTLSSFATSKTPRVRSSLCQTIGFKHLWAACSQGRRSQQGRHHGAAGWSKRLHRPACHSTAKLMRARTEHWSQDAYHGSQRLLSTQHNEVHLSNTTSFNSFPLRRHCN